ncbi:MAG: hypothetical protein IT423_02010 [Pirellulaceae bacterium]|nr:hypothetical protein [Pirellulaceae bacterium]
MTFFLAFAPGSAASLFVFVIVCAAVLFALVWAAQVAKPPGARSTKDSIRLAVTLVVYCGLIAAIVLSGVFQRAFIPYGPLFIFSTTALAIWVGFTKLGTSIAMGIPLGYLVAFQGFRLPLEWVLHEWFLSGTVPETMTWSGLNWDVITGLLACLSCALVGNRLWLAWLFNLVGIALLVNVARVAIMSSPVPFGWRVDPPLELIVYLPYAYIVPICVGGAALGHVMLTRRLLAETRPTAR